MTLEQFLTYASGEGVNAVVGFILAFVLELAPKFETYPPRQKRLITMGLSFVVPVAATGGLLVLQAATQGRPYPTGVETVNLVWRALAAGFAAFFGSQAGHAALLPATARTLSGMVARAASGTKPSTWAG